MSELLPPLIRIKCYHFWNRPYITSGKNCIWRTTALGHGLVLILPAHALSVAIVPGDEGIADARAGRRLGVAVVLLAHLPAGPSLSSGS